MSADLEDLDAPDYDDLDAPDFGDDSIDLEDPDGAQNTEGGWWTRPTFTAIHLAAAAAAGLVIGFLAGGATTGAPTPATAAVVASTPTAPGGTPTKAATAPTHDPGDLATGNPWDVRPTTPTTTPTPPTYNAGTTYPASGDPLLAGYSTRSAPQYVKMLCYPYVRPDACLVQWEKSQGLFYPNGYTH